jgi:hypothetical protein
MEVGDTCRIDGWHYFTGTWRGRFSIAADHRTGGPTKHTVTFMPRPA